MQADIVFRNGNIWTGDERLPGTDALAVMCGRVVALGEDARTLGGRREVDLGGHVVVPGFHDVHAHSVHFGLALQSLDLSTPNVNSLDELYAAVAQRAAATPRGEWIIGARYDQNKIGGHPTREGLDRAGGDHPVWLQHVSAHMCTVNSAVLEQLGDSLAQGVSGGAVYRDDDGAPTGLLAERAQTLVQDLLYPYSLSSVVEALRLAHARYAVYGITSVCDAGIGLGWVGHGGAELAAYQDALDAEALVARTTVMVTEENLHQVAAREEDHIDLGLDLGLRSGLGDARLRIGPVKMFADGSLIGRTCFMHEPFADAPGDRGMLQMDAAELRRKVLAAHRAGWQCAVHAIGDAAVDLTVDVYEEALTAFPAPDRRHRIEHCGVTSDKTLQRIAKLGLVPVPQGTFISELGDGMAAALGPKRSDLAYRLRSFVDAGVTLPASTDLPVTSGVPLECVRDMVTRRTGSGEPFGPDEALTPARALRAYTQGSAYATHREADLGTLTYGKLADFVILSKSPLEAEPAFINDIEVLGTAIGGELVYER